MMKTQRFSSFSAWRLPLMLLADLTMILLEIPVLRICWNDSGTHMFLYYTNNSNLFALLVCALSAVTTVILLLRGKRQMPSWLALLRLIAAGCLALTMLVAAFVIVPMENSGSLFLLRRGFVSFMLKGTLLYLHTLCPLLMIFSLLFLGDVSQLKLRHSLLAVIPTFLYGVFLIWLNVGKYYAGPYPFCYVYRQPVIVSILWYLSILTASFLAMQGLRLLSRFTAGRFWGRDTN